MLANPIVLKELLQAAHRKRTYAFRALLVAGALAAAVPRMFGFLVRGQDWRTIAELSHGVFSSGSWTALIVFSLFAYVYSTGSVSEEWRRRTMDVLCASPLSWPGIVFGKLTGVFGKLGMLALALLPVLGVWRHMARVPQRMALGAFAIVFAGAFFVASVALLQSVLFKPGRGYALSFCALLAPYYVLIGAAYAATNGGAPLLEAAFSPRALHLVLTDSPPGGMSVAGFVGLSLAVHLGLGALALALAPAALARTFQRHCSAATTRFAKTLRRMAGRRPAMKPNEDPFFWQEKGPATALLRWIVWAGLGVMGLLVLVRLLAGGEMEIFAWTAASAGALSLPLGSMIYGANVFAREKARGSAPLLILTGASPARILRVKLFAVYRALRWTLLLVAGLGVVGTYVQVSGQWGSGIPPAFLWIMLLSALRRCLTGPASAVAVAMVFSVHARSGLRAAGALLATVAAGQLLFFVLMRSLGVWAYVSLRGIAPLTILAAAVLGLLAFVRRWRLWHLCVLAMLVSWLQTSALGVLGGLASGWVSNSDSWFMDALVFQGVQTWLSLLIVAFWFWLGTRLFEAGMTEQACPLRPRRALQAGLERIGRAVGRGRRYGTEARTEN